MVTIAMRSLSLLLAAFLVCTSLNKCLALASAAKLVKSSAICGNDWYYFMESEACYHIPTEETPFASALSYCQGLSAELVSILDSMEYGSVSLILEQQEFVEPYWIGLQTYEYTPYFRWLDRTNAGYTHWINGTTPPHTDRNACFAWSKTPANNGWFQVDCQNPLPFICKRNVKVDHISRYNATAGDLYSPNYPRPYDADSVASYYIQVPYSYIIELTFDLIAIDSESFIKVFDAENLVAIITRIDRAPIQIVLTTNTASIHFNASEAGNAKYIGWSGSFRAVIPTTTEGSWTSPNYPSDYNANESITKWVQVPYGFSVAFTIWDFDSEPIHDYLTIFDERGYAYLNVSGHGSTLPLSVRLSSHTEARLYWHTSSPDVYRGFNLTWVADPNYG
uniref:C-type lectin domain-containing protein n=1 Tax=Panagrellus redivivus TaxID=6233 RepID=A0A7E4VYX9_PANRE